MQWSKIRTRLKALVCDTLRDRVDFHQTVYRTHHNDVGGVCKCRDARELWITIDGLQIFRASYCKYAHQLFLMWCAGFSSSERDQATKDLPLQEIHSPEDVGTLFKNYLDLDPRISLRSGDPILRALAIIDRRIGLRTLKQLKVKDDEHSLVRMFYALRLPGQPRSSKRPASRLQGPKLP